MRVWMALVVVASLGTACRGARLTSPEVDELLALHRADARAARAGREAGGPADLAAFEAQVLEIRKEWDEKLRAPEKLLTFLDFASPTMQPLVEEAKGGGFAASLAQDATLDRILAGAFVRNPGLRAAHQRLAGTIEQYAQVTYLDTILRQYVSFLRDLDTRVGPTVPMEGVAKRFPFPGTLELKAAIVGHAVEEARARYEIALQDLVTEVRVTYADSVFVFRSIANTEETLRYLKQLEETARGKLATGAAQKTHVIQTQVQISQLENDLVSLHRNGDTLRARLNALLDLPLGTPFAEPVSPRMPPFPASVESLYDRAASGQPAVLAASARAARMATMIELAEQATYPELSPGLSLMVGISHATGGSGKEREPFSTRPKIKPDPWFGTKDAYLREARERERGARLRVTEAQDRTAYRLHEAWNQLDAAHRLFELYRDVQLSQAEEAYSDASSAYAADRVEFLNVIDALRQWLRFLLDADRAERDYHRAYARLEDALGGPVTRRRDP